MADLLQRFCAVFLVSAATVACGTVFAADNTGEETKKKEKLTAEELEKQFEVVWGQVTAHASRPLDKPSVNRSIYLAGELKITKEVNILGICSTAELTKVTDDAGNALHSPKDGKLPKQPQSQQRHYSYPHRLPDGQPWFGKLYPASLHVNVPFGDQPLPPKIGKVEGKILMLVGTTTPIDVPLTQNADWVDVGPGLHIRLKKAKVNGGSIEYAVESQTDDPSRQYHGWVGPHHKMPRTIIMRAALVDDAGKEYRIGNTPFGQNTGGQASFGDAKKLTTMRFYVTTDPQELAIPFELSDIELPTFTDE